MSIDGAGKTILVAGATGTTGGEVARQLAAAGATVRGLTRSEDSAARLRAAGYEAVVADLSEPSGLPAALEGVDAVYVASPGSPELPEHEGAFAAAAAAAGVSLFVKLSVIGAAPDGSIDFARIHAAAEASVLAAGVPTTLLRPNGFMQNTLAWAGQIPGGTIYGPVMDARWSIVDVADIAAVAVTALLDPATHAGQIYTLTGPEASSPREQVAIVAELLGRSVEAQEVPIPTAQESMLGSGYPAWAVERLGELFEAYATGEFEPVTSDIETVLGRPARTYREFATEHLAAFSG